MTISINVPNIGEDELEITEIMVKIGDTISINQSLIVIEGDKSSMEIPAPFPGIVTEIYVHVGDTVHTGSVILSINTNDCIHTSSYNNQENISSEEIIHPSNIKNNKYKNQELIHDNNHIIHNVDNPSSDYIYATPLIRHMARELGVNLSKIKGSGRKGRILKEDIQKYIHTQNHGNIPIKPERLLPITLSGPKIDFSKFGETETIALSKIQKISGTNLQRNWIISPHVTQFDEIDITDLEAFRKQQNLEIEKKKVNYKITPLIFVMKAAAKALEEFPRFNSSLSQDGCSLILKKYINIGIAVDTPKGLLVPVLRNVNKKNILILSKELSEISKKAFSGNQLSPIDMQGGSFTISSLGNIGGTAFTPIINAPEVAILGISKFFMKPIWTGKKFIPRLILPISLSYDHRVIDGADGARFITLINKIISDIRLLSM